MSEYNHGQLNEAVSLPVDYWIEGNLIDGPELGKSVRVFRQVRNGVASTGNFVTSAVTEVGTGYFKTMNSHYMIHEIQEAQT